MCDYNSYRSKRFHRTQVKHVEELLEEKRKEVEERMLQCDIKRAMLREKQDKVIYISSVQKLTYTCVQCTPYIP